VRCLFVLALGMLLLAILGCTGEQQNPPMPQPPAQTTPVKQTASTPPSVAQSESSLNIVVETPASSGEPFSIHDGDDCYNGARSFEELRACASIRDSANLWTNEQKPYAVLGHRFYPDGNARILLQYVNSKGTSTINGIRISGASGETTIGVQPGQTVALVVSGMPRCKSGEVYSYPLEISYLALDSTIQTETGEKPLVGKCA